MNRGDRIKQVRELSGLTQIALATLIKKDQSLIAQVEGGLKEPSDELIRLIAFKTGFPPNFFRQQPAPEFPVGSLALRAHASLTRRDKLRAYRYAQLSFEFAEMLAKDVSLVPTNIPRVDVEPTEAARVARAHFGLSPDRPIGQLLNVIERMGVFILLLPLNLPNLDAFSLWAGQKRDKPIIAASASRSGDRVRFSVAHELWHLMSLPVGKPLEIERQADQFAAEFLMPRAGIAPEITVPVTLTAVAQLKARWGVSMQAIVRRAFDLQKITERQYRYLMQQISMRGWRKTEPVEIPFEKPTAFVRMVKKHFYGNNRTTIAVFPSSFLKNMLAAYESVHESHGRDDGSGSRL